MAIKLGGKSIKSMYLGGKSVKEAWLNGEKVWPDYNSPILGYEPTIFMPLNGDALDYSGNNHNPIGMVGTLESYTVGFNHSKCWDLISGGAALTLDPITRVRILLYPFVFFLWVKIILQEMVYLEE